MASFAPAPSDPYSEPPFAALTPACMLDALESVGWRVDGRLLALNSFENRVYQMGLEDGSTVVAKFYRPHRWSRAQILEEHAFTAELAQAEIAVSTPLLQHDQTLHEHAGFLFAVYARQGGRAPELEHPGTLEQLGRLIGRMHAVGARTPFSVRPALTLISHGTEPLTWLREHHAIPPDLQPAWQAVTEHCLTAVHQAFERVGPLPLLRLHGDMHLGNVLWTDQGAHVLDFDDARQGPAIQDLWMMLSGPPALMSQQLTPLVRGYRMMMDFDERSLALIEPLRTLRLMHYTAWLARRWHDPAFPCAFPWFGTPRYWQDRILELREQLGAMSQSDSLF